MRHPQPTDTDFQCHRFKFLVENCPLDLNKYIPLVEFGSGQGFAGSPAMGEGGFQRRAYGQSDILYSITSMNPNLLIYFPVPELR